MENSNFKILIVDDEPDIIEFVSYNLRKEGFHAFSAQNGKQAINLAKEINPDLILLDVMMPQMDGIETCEELRRIPTLQNVLITFLTARAEDYSQIAGLEAGADDYITKPIKPKVLLSRIKALLKRRERVANHVASESKIVEIGDLVIDEEKFIISLHGDEFTLPRKEFKLLQLLVSKPEKVFTREEIYNSVWGSNVIVGDRTIDVHIRKLREKIGDDYIQTVKGVGYKFVA